jgi:hypothetical protein
VVSVAADVSGNALTDSLGFVTDGGGEPVPFQISAIICENSSDVTCSNDAIYGIASNKLSDTTGNGFVHARVTDFPVVSAQGSVQIGNSSGGVGTINSIIIGTSSNLLSTPVADAGTDAATATAVATNINANVSTPNFTANAVGDLVTITAVLPGNNIEGITTATTTLTALDSAMGSVRLGAGSVQANVLVEFSLSNNVGVLTSLSAITDANGLAIVPIAPGAVSGAGLVTVNANPDGSSAISKSIAFASKGDGVANPLNYQISLNICEEVIATPPALPSSVTCTPIGTVVNPIDTAAANSDVWATVTDNLGNPVANILVLFELANEAGALSNTFALTNSNGQATVDLGPGVDPGIGTITISANPDGNTPIESSKLFITDGGGLAEPFILSVEMCETGSDANLGGCDDLPATGTGVYGTGSNPLNDADGYGFVTVLITDDAAIPVVQTGVVVNFNLETAVGVLLTTSGVTDDNGLVVVQLAPGAVAGAGGLIVTADPDGNSPLSNTLIFSSAGDGLAVPTSYGISVVIEDAASGGSPKGGAGNPITTNDPGYVIANVTLNGTNLEDELVTFTLSNTNGVLVQDTALTDDSGNAVAQLNPGATTGAGTVTVSVVLGGTTFTDTVNFASSVSAPSTSTISLGVDFSNSAKFCDLRAINGKITTNTTDATDGSYDAITTTTDSAFGAGLTLDVVVVDGVVVGVQIVNPGTGYVATDTVTIAAGAVGPAGIGSSTDLDLTLPINNDDAYVPLAIYVEDKEATPCQVSGFNDYSPIATGFSLKTGVTSNIKVNVYNESDSVTYDSPVEVTFSSLCAEIGKATLGSNAVTTSTVTSVAGVATTTYLADGCVGEDTITAVATVGTDNLAAQVTFDIETPAVSSIEFVSAVPKVLALKGTGGANRVETSVLKFRVVGADGNPSANRNVYLALSNEPGGVSLDTNSATSNADGIVEVTVSSGSVSGTLKVRAIFDVDADDAFDGNGLAIIDADDIVVFSDELSISSGLPDADGINIFAEILNPEAWNYPNETVQVTASLNDRSGENVAVGTAVYFRTELGRIGDVEGDAVCYTDVTGSCSVIWHSNGAEQTEYLHYDSTAGQGLGKPGGNSNAIDYDRRGRNVIYASTQGEETFVDVNGNNLYDVLPIVDAYIDIGEFFFDLNESGTREINAGPPSSYLEPYQEFNGDNTQNPGDGFFSGVSCSEDAIVAGHCADLVNVYDSLTMSVSTSGANIYLSSTLSDLEYHGFVNSNGVPDWQNFDPIRITMNTNTATATNNDYVALATTTSGAGTGLTLDLTVAGGAVTVFSVNDSGTGYTVGDTVTVAGGLISSGTDVIFNYPVPLSSAAGPQSSASYASLGATGTVYGVITDTNGNAMPEGTTVTASASSGFAILGNSSFTIGSSSLPTTFGFTVEFDTDRIKDGLVTVTAETPKGNVTSRSFTFIAPATTGGCHTIHFGEASRTITEGASNANVTVEIQVETPVFGCTDPIILDYFISGHVVGDHEFNDVDGDTSPFSTVTLNTGNNYSATVSFTIFADADPEGSEVMSAFIGISSTDTSGATIGTNSSYVLTIDDDGDV